MLRNSVEASNHLSWRRSGKKVLFMILKRLVVAADMLLHNRTAIFLYFLRYYVETTTCQLRTYSGMSVGTKWSGIQGSIHSVLEAYVYIYGSTVLGTLSSLLDQDRFENTLHEFLQFNNKLWDAVSTAHLFQLGDSHGKSHLHFFPWPYRYIFNALR